MTTPPPITHKELKLLADFLMGVSEILRWCQNGMLFILAKSVLALCWRLGRDRIRNWPMVRHFFNARRVSERYNANYWNPHQDIMDAVQREMDDIQDEPQIEREPEQVSQRIQVHIVHEPCPNCEHPLKTLCPDFMRWKDNMHGLIPCFTLLLDECESCGAIFNRKCPHNEQAIYFGLAVQALADTKEETSEYTLHAAFTHIANYGMPKSWIRAIDYIREADVYAPLSEQLAHMRTCFMHNLSYRMRTSQGIISFHAPDNEGRGTNEGGNDCGLWRSLAIDPPQADYESPLLNGAVMEQTAFAINIPDFEQGIIDAFALMVMDGDPPPTEAEVDECRRALVYSYAMYQNEPQAEDETVNVMTWMQRAYGEQMTRLAERRAARPPQAAQPPDPNVPHYFMGQPISELSQEQQNLLLDYVQTGNITPDITAAMRQAFEQNARRQRAREAGFQVPPLDTSILHDFGYRGEVAPTAIDGGISVGQLNVVGGRTGVGHSVLQQLHEQTLANSSSLRINGRPFNEASAAEQEAFMSVIRHAQLHANGERCEDCDRINGVDTQQEMS